MVIQICVGSSCHIKGSAEIVELLQQAVAENGLENEVTLAGSFCIGKCNRVGVTVQVDDEVHVGVTREGFREFFDRNVLAKLR
ncbi:MAG: (2Fe-2S) ferredoxin domain-containing protein [Clostridia bacterium]|nr:(2Fe-2S) ferredoxin domain-containing protein [Clostridia bacterium]